MNLTAGKNRISEIKANHLEISVKMVNIQPDWWEKEREKTHVSNIKNLTGVITANSKDNKKNNERIIATTLYYKFDNFNEMENFLERHKLLKLTQGETDNLNSPIFIF